MFIIVYRPHGELKIDTKHYGPYNSHDEAYEALCKLPAIGIAKSDEQDIGCKYIAELERK